MILTMILAESPWLVVDIKPSLTHINDLVCHHPDERATGEVFDDLIISQALGARLRGEAVEGRQPCKKGTVNQLRSLSR